MQVKQWEKKMSVLSSKNLTTAYNAEHTVQYSTRRAPFLYNHIRNVRQRDTGQILDTLFFNS